MQKRAGFASFLVLALLTVGLVISVFLIGRQTFFNNHAQEPSRPWPISPFGNALKLSANGDGVATTSATLNNLQTFTVEAWAKLDSTSTNDEYILRKRENSYGFYNDSFAFISSPLANQFLVRLGVSSGVLIMNMPNFMNDRAWHHLALVNDPASKQTSRFYVDGVLKATQNHLSPLIANTGSFNIGLYKGDFSPTGEQSFLGQIDEVRVSNLVRYTTNFALPSQAFAADKSTLALWHLDESKPSSLGFGLKMTPDSSLTRVGGQSEGILKGNTQFISSTVPASRSATKGADGPPPPNR